MNQQVSRPTCTAEGSLVGALLAVNVCGLLCWAIYRLTCADRMHLVDPERTLFWGPAELNAYLLLISPYYDASAQKHAYMGFLGAVAGLVLLAPWLGSFAAFCARPETGRWAYALLTAGGAAAFLWSYSRQLAGWPLVAGIMMTLLTGALARGLLRRERRHAWGAVSVLLVAAATVPGFFLTYDLSRQPATAINLYDQHFSMVAGPIDRLAAGQRVVPHYGLLMPLLLASWQRWLGPLDMAGYVVAFQLGNALYLCLALYLLARYSRGRGFLALLAILAVIPGYHYYHQCLVTPNQAAWRTLGFPLSLLAIWLVRARSLATSAVLLGVVAGVALLLNFESGVAALVGVLAYLCFRFRILERGQLLRRAGIGAVGVALGLTLSAAGFLLGVRGLLGYWPAEADAGRLKDNVSFLFAALSGGLPYQGYLLPALMALHAAVVLVQTALMPKALVGFRASFRASVAAILLVWLQYYVNRPHFWNLTSFYFLYGFLFIDLLRSVLVPLARARTTWPMPWRERRPLRLLGASALLALVVMPVIVHTTTEEAGNLLESTLAPPAAESVLVSGVLLPEKVGMRILDQAEFLRRESGARPATYLAAYSFLVANVSRIYAPLPGCGSVFEYADRTRYRQLTRAMLQAPTGRIYFDSASDDLPAYADFYFRVRDDLVTQFRPTHVRHGWEVWERPGPHNDIAR